MAERASPQARLNTRALEVVAEMKGELAGHKDLDALQFSNVKAELTDIKSDIKQLSTDAKQAIDALEKKGDGNHKDNQNWMQRLELKLDGISSRNSGAAWLGMTIRDWLILFVAASALIVPLVRHG